MRRLRQMGIAVALSLASAASSSGQPIPAPANPARTMPAGLVPGNPVPVEAKEVPTIHNGLPLEPAPGDDELRRLLIARYNAALGEWKMVKVAHQNGFVGFDQLPLAARHLFRASRELFEKPADQIVLSERYFDSTKQFELQVKSNYLAGSNGPLEMHHATYLRLDAEIQLLRAKRKASLAK